MPETSNSAFTNPIAAPTQPIVLWAEPSNQLPKASHAPKPKVPYSPFIPLQRLKRVPTQPSPISPALNVPTLTSSSSQNSQQQPTQNPKSPPTPLASIQIQPAATADELVHAITQLAEQSCIDRFQLHYDYAEERWKAAEKKCQDLEAKLVLSERQRGEEKGRLEAEIRDLRQKLKERDPLPSNSCIPVQSQVEETEWQGPAKIHDEDAGVMLLLRQKNERLLKDRQKALSLQGNQMRAAREKVKQDLLNANNRIIQLEEALSLEKQKLAAQSQKFAALLKDVQKRKEDEEKLVERVKAQFGTIIETLKEENAELTTKLQVEQSQHSRNVLELQEAKADTEKRLDEETKARARLLASLTMTIQTHGSDLKRKPTPLKMGMDSERENGLASTSEVERPMKRVRTGHVHEESLVLGGLCEEEPVEERRPVDSKA